MSKNRSKYDTKAPSHNSPIHTKAGLIALTQDELDFFNRNVIHRKYRAGQYIFLQGDPCLGLYFVDDGVVAVRKVDEEGNSAIVRLAHQGDILGYRPLLAKENHRAAAEVIDDTRISFVSAPIIRRLLLANPKLGMRFLENTARALGEAEERMFQVAALSVRTRIIHLLILLCDHCGTTTSDGTLFIELPLTRSGLADMIGARPESVTRALRDIQDDGLLNLSGRMVRVGRVDRLIDELHHNLHH